MSQEYDCRHHKLNKTIFWLDCASRVCWVGGPSRGRHPTASLRIKIPRSRRQFCRFRFCQVMGGMWSTRVPSDLHTSDWCRSWAGATAVRTSTKNRAFCLPKPIKVRHSRTIQFSIIHENRRETSLHGWRAQAYLVPPLQFPLPFRVDNVRIIKIITY